MRVVFFHRKPRPNYNFSVESLFMEVRRALPKEVTPIVKQFSFYSEGLFNRIFLCLEAFLHQGEINHITGDINFVNILLRKKRTVLTILDVGFMNHPNPLARFVLKWFWIVLPVRRARVVTTISISTKNELMKYVNVNPDKIKVIYVPILSSYQPCPKEFNKNRPVILQLGTKHNKNLVRLIEALSGIPCFLDIIGEIGNDLKEKLEHFNIQYQASKNLTSDQVLDRYKQSDVVSFVSTYEGFGMPIVEANAVGRVVVTSNVLSMPEVAGEAAHLVDPFNVESIRRGILKVINDDGYRDQLIENGFVNCKRFEVKQIAIQFAELYKEMIGKGS